MQVCGFLAPLARLERAALSLAARAGMSPLALADLSAEPLGDDT